MHRNALPRVYDNAPPSRADFVAVPSCAVDVRPRTTLWRANPHAPPRLNSSLNVRNDAPPVEQPTFSIVRFGSLRDLDRKCHSMYLPYRAHTHQRLSVLRIGGV